MKFQKFTGALNLGPSFKAESRFEAKDESKDLSTGLLEADIFELEYRFFELL